MTDYSSIAWLRPTVSIETEINSRSNAIIECGAINDNLYTVLLSIFSL